MISQLQIKFRTFFNQSKTLAAGYSINENVHRLREEDHTGMTWVSDQHCHLLAMNTCIPSNQETDNGKKCIFFPFASKKKKLRAERHLPTTGKDLSRQTLFETCTTSQLDPVFHSTFPSLGVDA